uniref:Uncharacterized protein n=1 Tax=Rhizophora mucronata TaxID=61149 RepID=A0A2P2QCT5_RHIMU
MPSYFSCKIHAICRRLYQSMKFFTTIISPHTWLMHGPDPILDVFRAFTFHIFAYIFKLHTKSSPHHHMAVKKQLEIPIRCT